MASFGHIVVFATKAAAALSAKRIVAFVAALRSVWP